MIKIKQRWDKFSETTREDLVRIRGSKDKDIIKSIVLSIIFFFMGLGLLLHHKDDVIDKYFLNFMGIEILIITYVIIAITFVKLVNEKYIEYAFLLLKFTVIIFYIAISPITLFSFIINKSGYENLNKYKGIYFSYIILLPCIDILSFIILLDIFNSISWINIYVLIMFLIFTLNWGIMIVIAKIALKYKMYMENKKFKKICTEEEKQNEAVKEHEMIIDVYKNDSKRFEKELYVLNYFLIAIITSLFYIVNIDALLPDIPTDFDKNLLCSFSIYVAFDRLYDKWKKNIVSKT